MLDFVLLARNHHMSRSRLDSMDVFIGARLAIRLRTLEMIDGHELPRIKQARLLNNLAPAFLVQHV